MTKRVAIIAALPREIAGLVRGWRQDEALAKRRRIFVYTNEDAVVACAGMGAARVSLAVEAALAGGTVSEIISVGWAGGLHAGISAGSLHEPGLIIDARTGERFSAGRGEGVRGEGGCSECVLVTAGSVAGPMEKRRLRETYGADLVDMEAAAVARIAQGQGLPFRSLKVVSDTHDFEMPELARFSTQDGWFREGAFALHVAVRPHLWGKAMTMAHASKESAATLCERLRLQLGGR